MPSFLYFIGGTVLEKAIFGESNEKLLEVMM